MSSNLRFFDRNSSFGDKEEVRLAIRRRRILKLPPNGTATEPLPLPLPCFRKRGFRVRSFTIRIRSSRHPGQTGETPSLKA